MALLIPAGFFPAVTHVQHALLNSKQLGRCICIRWVEHLQTFCRPATDCRQINVLNTWFNRPFTGKRSLGCQMWRANTAYLLELWEDFKFLAEIMLRDRTASAAESSTSGLFLIRPNTGTMIWCQMAVVFTIHFIKLMFYGPGCWLVNTALQLC